MEITGENGVYISTDKEETEIALMKEYESKSIKR